MQVSMSRRELTINRLSAQIAKLEEELQDKIDFIVEEEDHPRGLREAEDPEDLIVELGVERAKRQSEVDILKGRLDTKSSNLTTLLKEAHAVREAAFKKEAEFFKEEAFKLSVEKAERDKRHEEQKLLDNFWNLKPYDVVFNQEFNNPMQFIGKFIGFVTQCLETPELMNRFMMKLFIRCIKDEPQYS
jgi:hypothetical protein